MPLFSLGEAIDLFKEENDAGSSHLMLVLHSVLLLWNAATEGRGGEISGSHGETQVSFTLAEIYIYKKKNRLTSGVRRSSSGKKWSSSAEVTNSNTKSSLFLLCWTIYFYFFLLFKNCY